MQAVDDRTLVLYYTDLRAQWPHAAARVFAAGLPYVRRLAAQRDDGAARASVAGVALALRALTRLTGRQVRAAELVFAQHQKPYLATALAAAGDMRALACAPTCSADFSIAHSGTWVGCAAMLEASVGLDIETGSAAHIADWVVRESLLKASGEGLRALTAVRAVALTPAATSVPWRGRDWHLTRPDCFAGAAACIATTATHSALELRAFTPDALLLP
jgi:phosphopantetheinyl transferase